MAVNRSSHTMGHEYASHSEPQKKACRGSVPHIADCFERHLFADCLSAQPGPVYICDYGSGPGRNSFGPMAAIVKGVQREQPGRGIVVVHNDLPNNNFSALCCALASEEKDSDSYQIGAKDVYSLVSGLSFYRQVLPSNSVHIGYSSTAMHWLSAIPKYISACSFMNAQPAERRACQECAAADWQTLLSARAAELVSGGVLILSNVTSGPEASNYYLTTFTGLMYSVAKTLMTAQELEAFSIPHYFRSTREFEDAKTLAGCGLRLVQPSAVEDIDDPFKEILAKDGAQAYAKKFVAVRRAIFDHSVREAFNASSRASDVVAAELEKYWQAVEAEVANNADKYPLNYKQCFTILQKI